MIYSDVIKPLQWIAVAFMLTLAGACGQTNQANTEKKAVTVGGIPLPLALLTASAQATGSLKAYAKVDNGPRREMTIDLARNVASLTLPNVPAGNHILSIELEYAPNGSGTQQLILTRASKAFTIFDKDAPVTIEPGDYVFDIDDDNDGMFNRDEVNTQGYHPFQADPIYPNLVDDQEFSVVENTNEVFVTVFAQAPKQVQYQLLEIADYRLFTLDATTGDLRFTEPPDHEIPLNQGTVVNTYDLWVRATDGAAHNDKRIKVVVTDVFDLSIIGRPKQLEFRWTPLAGASYYKLLESADGLDASYAQIGGDITTGTYSIDMAAHLYPWATAKYRLEAYDASDAIVGSPTPEVFAASKMLDSIGRFTGTNTKEGDEYATVVAVSKDGKTLAVGAPREDSAATLINGNAQDDCANPVVAQLNCAADSGAVYIYTRSDTGAWSQQAYIKAPNTDAGDLFGSSVSLSADGNTLAVGAVGEQSTSSTDTANDLGTGVGAVYVYKRGEDQASVVVWANTAYIKPQQSALDQVLDNHAFGAGLDLDNNGFNLVIMANGSSRRGYSVSLAATGIAGVTAELANSSSFNANIQGIAISGDGNTAVIGGSYSYNDNSVVKYGDNIQIYARNGTIWFNGQNILRPGSSGMQPDGVSDAFGKGLSINDDGTTIAVGAPEDDSDAIGVVGTVSANNSAIDSGAVYIYNYNSNSEIWNVTPLYIKAFNTLAGNGFGESVSLSPDGTLLAVGAPLEGSGEIGVFDATAVEQTAANSSGAVYTYTRDNSSQQNPRWIGSAYVKAKQASKSFGTQCMLSDGALPQTAPASTLIVGGREDAFYLY